MQPACHGRHAWRSSEVIENSALTSGPGKVGAPLEVLSVHWTPGCHSFDSLFRSDILDGNFPKCKTASGNRAFQGAQLSRASMGSPRRTADEVRAAEPSKSHLTTRMVTSSSNPISLQNSAALRKISTM